MTDSEDSPSAVDAAPIAHINDTDQTPSFHIGTSNPPASSASATTKTKTEKRLAKRHERKKIDKQQALRNQAQLRQLQSTMDPIFRKSRHRYIGKWIELQLSLSPPVNEEPPLHGVIIGHIKDTDTDEDGVPQFTSTRTKIAAALFHARFTDGTERDFEEWELSGDDAVCKFVAPGELGDVPPHSSQPTATPAGAPPLNVIAQANNPPASPPAVPTPRNINYLSNNGASNSTNNVFTPETERTRQMFKSCMDKYDTPTRTKLLTSLFENRGIATKPSHIETYYTTAKGLYRKYNPPQKSNKQSKRKRGEEEEEPDPIDEKAFQFYPPSWGGGKHRSDGQHDNPQFNLEQASYHAQWRAKGKVKSAILQGGDDDQISLALRDALNDPEVKPHYERVLGERHKYDPEKVKVGCHLVDCMHSLAGQAIDTVDDDKNNNGLTKPVRSLLNGMGMCATKGKDGADNQVLRSEIHRQVFSSMSVGATYRLLAKAAGKRKRIDEGDDEGFNVVEKEERRCKYQKTEVDEFRNYMLNNLYTRDSPRKKDVLQ